MNLVLAQIETSYTSSFCNFTLKKRAIKYD